MKAVEGYQTKLSHVDVEDLTSKLLSEFEATSIRLREAVTVWDGYITSHSELEDSLLGFSNWLNKQSIKAQPPSSMETCQQNLQILQVSIVLRAYFKMRTATFSAYTRIVDISVIGYFAVFRSVIEVCY